MIHIPLSRTPSYDIYHNFYSLCRTSYCKKGRFQWKKHHLCVVFNNKHSVCQSRFWNIVFHGSCSFKFDIMNITMFDLVFIYIYIYVNDIAWYIHTLFDSDLRAQGAILASSPWNNFLIVAITLMPGHGNIFSYKKNPVIRQCQVYTAQWGIGSLSIIGSVCTGCLILYSLCQSVLRMDHGRVVMPRKESTVYYQ